VNETISKFSHIFDKHTDTHTHTFIVILQPRGWIETI